MVKSLLADAGDAGDAGSAPGSGRSPGGGNGIPLQVLAWEIPWTEEPGGLQSMGFRAGHHLVAEHIHAHGQDREPGLFLSTEESYLA